MKCDNFVFFLFFSVTKENTAQWPFLPIILLNYRMLLCKSLKFVHQTDSLIYCKYLFCPGINFIFLNLWTNHEQSNKNKRKKKKNWMSNENSAHNFNITNEIDVYSLFLFSGYLFSICYVCVLDLIFRRFAFELVLCCTSIPNKHVNRFDNISRCN